MRRIVKDYENLDPAIKNAIQLEYPFGVDEFLKKIEIPGKKPFYALIFEFVDTVYLVRFNEAGDYYFDQGSNDDDDDMDSEEAFSENDDYGFDEGEDDDDE